MINKLNNIDPLSGFCLGLGVGFLIIIIVEFLKYLF